MSRVALAALLTGIWSAAEAHWYSVWRYPYPQHCRATALARPERLPRTRLDVTPPVRELRFIEPAPVEFSLPDMDDFVSCPDADEEMRARLLLRVLMQGREK